MDAEDIRTVEQRARERALASPSGIGAAVAMRLADAPDGLARFRVRLSDGQLFGWVEAVLADRAAAPETVERAVEQAALADDASGRLLVLESRSPIHVGGSG